ncbi:MAG: hypothetical protein GY797_02695 [Deltaproteobacteria bacterium]|nr:hypothetical protein [Deltaproteobacteria bacterium]
MHALTIISIFLIFLGTIGTYWGQNLQATKNVKKQIIRSDDLLTSYIEDYEEQIDLMYKLHKDEELPPRLSDEFPFPAIASILLEVTDFDNGRLHLGKHRVKLNDSYFEKQKRIFDSIKYSFLKIDFDNFPELGTLFSNYIVKVETSNPDKIHEIINDDFSDRIIANNGSIERQPSMYYTPLTKTVQKIYPQPIIHM